MLVRTASLLAFNLVGVLSLWACSCSEAGPTRCQGLGQHQGIFVGTVLDVENPPNKEPKLDDTGLSRHRFRVEENFKGAPGSAIDVYSGRGGADCSYHFRQGTQYLVFAYQDHWHRQGLSCSGFRTTKKESRDGGNIRGTSIPIFSSFMFRRGTTCWVLATETILIQIAPFSRTFYSSSFESSGAQVIHLMAGEQFLTADIHAKGGRPTRSLTVFLKGEEEKSTNKLVLVSAKGSEGK